MNHSPQSKQAGEGMRLIDVAQMALRRRFMNLGFCATVRTRYVATENVGAFIVVDVAKPVRSMCHPVQWVIEVSQPADV